MAIIARHLIISGRVQGVWYRAWTIETAISLGIAGWVRNRHGGEVEAHVQGEEHAIERFIALAWRGPSAARVENIVVRPVAPEPLSGFSKRATA